MGEHEHDVAEQVDEVGPEPEGLRGRPGHEGGDDRRPPWYNVFATNDGIEKLGGQPFDNGWRWYTGSSDDLRLNIGVKPAATRSSPAGTSCCTA